MNSVDRLNTSLAGRYTIDREIGAGGMATVYLARDIKHGRNVALKVLKPELGAILGVERFLSEIKVTANLIHPHLLPLFDSGEADGCLFYVMPYVEGETLRHLLDRENQLPIEDAVRIAVAVASALAYAHERGVIHRDLKPENILLQAGHPVVADFGIALAVSNAGGERVTQTGLSLGTPHYMSPEQASGDRVIDARSDIYALGAVTYEMIAGEPPHSGSSAQAIIAKLMTSEPLLLRSLRKSVPANVNDAVETALQKSAADRFRTATAFADALTNPLFRAHHSTQSSSNGASAVVRWQRICAALGVVAIVGLGVAAWSSLRPRPVIPVLRFVIPMDAAPNTRQYGRVALSHDGSVIAYTGGPKSILMLKRRDDAAPAAVPGTEGAMAPFFSADDSQIGFTANGVIFAAATTGGRPVEVTHAIDGRFGAHWSADGFLYGTSAGRSRSLVRVSATPGAKAEPVTTLDTARGERTHLAPDMLPRGRAMLFTVFTASSQSIAVVDLQTGKHKTLMPGFRAHYAQPGWVIYSLGSSLLAVPFSERTLATTGKPVLLASDVHTGDVIDVRGFGVSADGTMAYVAGGESAMEELTWVSRDGTAAQVDPTWQGAFDAPRLSPDGKRVALHEVSKNAADAVIWIKQMDRGPALKLTPAGGYNGSPGWTPDGSSVTYQSNSGGSYDLWTQRADASKPAVRQMHVARALSESAWSPDGKSLVGRTSVTGPGEGDMLLIRPGLDTVAVPLVATRFTEKNMTFSPDGRWLAYSANESGRFEVYVVPFPNVTAARYVVSSAGGDEPRWSHSGRELFFRDASGRMISAAVTTSPVFAVTQSTALFDASSYMRTDILRSYDVSPEDRRFLMLRPVSASGSEQIVVVQNWFQAMKSASARTGGVR